MDTLPLVTVVTPSYQQGHFIEETIQSVKSQTYPRLEHIIVDGGSSDGTVDVLLKYEGTYNMRWISEPDRGQSEAINKGFRLANGQILSWLNSDDMYLPQAVECAVDYLNSHPRCDMVYGDYVMIDEQGRTIKPRKEIPFDLGMLIYTFGYVPSTTSFFRRRCVHEYGEWMNEDYHNVMDVDFFVRLGERGCRIAHIPAFMARWRCYAGAKSFAPALRSRLKAELWDVRRKHGWHRSNGEPMPDAILSAGTVYYRLKRWFVKLFSGCYW
jgi:glycosyltransferase involved in cell wall biosynthesis